MEHNVSSLPIISIVMPVFNREKYIAETIESILNQTYTDFELIIVNDGSTDKTREIIESFNDPRIILIEHGETKGVAAARNTGYSVSRGNFIAISDSDDINLPQRLEKQLTFLYTHEDIDVVSCWVKEFDEHNNSTELTMDINSHSIRSQMIFNPGVPAFMMFRKEKIGSLNCLYHDETYKAAVDYQWYASLPNSIKISCVPEVLYLYRRHYDQISTSGYSNQQYYANIIRKKELAKIGIEPTEHEFTIHYNVSLRKFGYCLIHLQDTLRWFEKLKQQNNLIKYYSTKEFNEMLNRISEKLFAMSKEIEVIKNKNRDIFIWGTGNQGLQDLELLKKYNVEIKGFIDSNSLKWNDEFEGFKIFSPEILNGKTNIFVLVSSMYWKDIYNQLNEFGLSERNDYTTFSRRL
ncbi:glycosyltransferase [Robertmurraya sp. DFI.2.37]|uniref:glycosyltransferase n=1 Tax=Robertmurraya sp. DFI.2.37 TaxID=3031819 RepID=UPI00124580F4|nr:glycosyltransferase [Robertmurraya sp. DFI.2.37]MDF1507839.1 glycosyltransferase [Robertmurraya sp. DFI.2.37]